MTSPYTYAVKLSGGLLLTAVLSSCTLFPSSPGGPDTPRSLAERMERHTQVLQKTIGPRNSRQPKSMEAAAKYIENNFSDMGYAVTLQPVTSGNSKKEAAIYNIVVYKPGLFSDNQSIVVGANYDSDERFNNGSGAAVLMETARDLRDIATNHNIYFVAYANGAQSAGQSGPSGAGVHAKMLSGLIGASNILGMINLEPQKTAVPGEGEQTKEAEPQTPVLFLTTPRGQEFAAQCAAPFAKSWEQPPSTLHRKTAAINSNDRHYAVLDIPTLSCKCEYSVTDSRTKNYVQALTDMIHQVADNDVSKTDKQPDAAQKPKQP